MKATYRNYRITYHKPSGTFVITKDSWHYASKGKGYTFNCAIALAQTVIDRVENNVNSNGSRGK